MILTAADVRLCDGELRTSLPRSWRFLAYLGQMRWLVKFSYKCREISVYTAATLSLPQPDHGVLRKAQRGDERAFSIIVRAYQIPVYNYVLRMVGDRSLAEDLTQEVFLRVFQGLPRFSLRSKFTTWMFQVTKNRVLDELRATERRPRAVVDLDDIPPVEVVDAPFERLEAIDAVWRAVERLNVDLKMALLLRDVVGLSYTEIADSLEVTLATVKWRIWKAREDVQLALAREGIEVYEDREVPAVAATAVAAPAPTLCPCPCSHRPPCRPPNGYKPSASRPASISGRPASRISLCVRSTSYSARRKLAWRASRSSRRKAARGSPSRG